MARDGKEAVPGAELGTEEEFIGGAGTYSEAGKIRASVAGSVAEENRGMSVRGRAALSPVGVGTVVYGRVENVIEPIALVTIEPLESGGRRFAELPGYAVLHASSIKRGYVKKVRDEIRAGDIIRAKVVDLRSGDVMLSTSEEGFGVVKAYCSRDRSPLRLANGTLVCGKCDGTENRKLAGDYGNLK